MISGADDRALDKYDLRPIAGAKVFVDPQYLDCVDKNYILVALHQRLLANHCTLVAKQDESDVVMEVGSGRTRFLALWGIFLGAGAAVTIVLTAVAFWVLPRCAG